MQQDMVEQTHNFGIDIVEGLITGITAVALYLFKKNRDSRILNGKLADMLMVEIVDIVETTKNTDLERYSRDFRYSGDSFPREVYDGLVNSGNLSNFDRNMQKELHDFYKYEKKSEYDRIAKNVKNILDIVDEFKHKNRLCLRYF